MEYEDLLLEKADGIATITLNAPHKLNALTVGMRRSLPLAAAEIARDDELRAVIVTGAGRGFCSGADLTVTSVEPARHQRLEVLGTSYGAEVFLRLDKPVVAAINGVCAGGGLAIALSMDIRIAAETARFSAIFVRRGLVPDCAIAYWLPRAVGTARAMELMLTGEIIDAREALRLGIVGRVVPPDELMSVARELAGRIARNPPVPVELTRRIVYRSMVDDIVGVLDWETWAQAICRQSEDAGEAIRAFLEKRAPAQFEGK